MADTWYRGEGVNVTPAKAGGVDNDIGDGMYLTDQLEVARQYALERAPNPNDRRVYSLQVDPGSMRVLDLTTDPRWKKHMSTPFPPQGSSGQWTTLESQMKSHPSSRQYKAHFENFLRANKMNLDDFDVVIGPEYRNGGKQMCILYKGGQSSPLQMKLRLQFVPVGGTVPTPKSPVGLMRFGGKIGPGLKIIGGTLVSLVVTLLLNWLFRQMQKEDLERQMEGLRPNIEKAVKQEKQRALKLLVDGKNAFATLRLSLTSHSHPDTGPDCAGGILETDPVLRFESLDITDKENNKDDGTDFQDFPGGVSMKKHFFLTSVPLSFSQEEVDLYRSYLKEIDWYEAQIKTAPSAQDSQRLSKDRENLIKQLNQALAD